LRRPHAASKFKERRLPSRRHLLRYFASTHYVNAAEVVLSRGAGFGIVRRSVATVAGIGLIWCDSGGRKR
jgi:hypothetical protein